MNLKFDYTINVGTLIQIALLIGGFVKLYGDFREMKLQVNAMWSVFMRTYGQRKSDKDIEVP